MLGWLFSKTCLICGAKFRRGGGKVILNHMTEDGMERSEYRICEECSRAAELAAKRGEEDERGEGL